MFDRPKRRKEKKNLRLNLRVSHTNHVCRGMYTIHVGYVLIHYVRVLYAMIMIDSRPRVMFTFNYMRQYGRERESPKY